MLAQNHHHTVIMLLKYEGAHDSINNLGSYAQKKPKNQSEKENENEVSKMSASFINLILVHHNSIKHVIYTKKK